MAYPCPVRVIGVLVLALAAAAGCRSAGVAPAAPRIVLPGAPGEASRVAASVDAPAARYSPADVRFMQGMIHHHAQALDMTRFVETRTATDDMRKLARRIEVSQTDEIRMMRTWLLDRGLEAPDEHAHHRPGAPLMPGMLTPAEMRQLEAAAGVEFDRLFLTLMIKHHEGALVMVGDLVGSPGAAEDADIFAFASDVEADQSMEINRMRAMLAAIR